MADQDEGEAQDPPAREDDADEGAPSPRASEREEPRWRTPLIVWLVVAAVYLLTLGPRITETSPDNHYAHLARSWLEGQLHLVGDPPGTNDWACYDTVAHDLCPNNRWSFPDRERYRWYVSFPPFPAVVILPAVAVAGVDVPDRLFWALIAAFGPALLYVLLRYLRETGRGTRRRRDDLLLTALFAFGTVFYFVAVQGTVWFAAHTVAVPLIVLYLLFGLDARRPVLAGLALGLCFLTRPTTAFLFPFFALEALRVSRRDGPPLPPELPWWKVPRVWLAGVDLRRFIQLGLQFSAPILLCGAVAMWMNEARFDDPFEFGHTYLQIRWRPRIERWGLFNYHYFGKNLAIMLASVPWLSQEPPYFMVSRHGLALWVTTPALLMVLCPKRTNATTVALWAAIIPVALLNLCYQNSGWVQFGYRFALDYMPLLFALLAMSGRRLGLGFVLLLVWSIAINLFGAVTFDRAWQFYDSDPTQNVIFQPD